MVFHTMPEYEEWKESLGVGGTKGWEIKYYKGLGTSTNDEAREYFANIEGNRKEFVWTGGRPRPRSKLRTLLTAILQVLQRMHIRVIVEPLKGFCACCGCGYSAP